MKTKLITALSILSLASCTTAYKKPDAVNVNVGGFTHHTADRKGKKDFNEAHNNIGVEVENDNYFMNVETMKDSFDNRNQLIAGGYKYCWNEYVCMPLGLGYFTGYKNVSFIPYSGLEFNVGRFTLRTAFMPPLAVEQGTKTGFFFVGGRFRVYEF